MVIMKMTSSRARTMITTNAAKTMEGIVRKRTERNTALPGTCARRRPLGTSSSVGTG